MLAPFLFMALQRKSPCKLNLLLNVLGKRPDGFHELETLLHPVAVFDCLEFERAGRGVELTCSLATLSAGPANLVHRAATGFLEAAGITEGVRIRLEKHVPLAAGLGGGSGNAAATLLGLNELFDQPLAPAALAELAARLGSDAPFFLQEHPALATGRGERIQPLGFFPALRGVWALLAYPGFGIGTAWAYQALAHFPGALHGQPGRAAQLIERLSAGDLVTASGQFYNALEMPALAKYPILALYQEFLRAAGALATLMSGSGSATLALARGEAAALQLRDKFLARFGANCWTAVVELGGGERET
jgi:4-diphosphocytidyl-2-C-methyl-D-erythritol kinase